MRVRHGEPHSNLFDDYNYFFVRNSVRFDRPEFRNRNTMAKYRKKSIFIGKKWTKRYLKAKNKLQKLDKMKLYSYLVKNDATYINGRPTKII